MLYDAGTEAISLVKRDTRGISKDDLSGYDAVVHLAELSNDPLGQLNPEITYKINHLGSVGLARAAREAGVKRFIYSSSCSVYGIGEGDDCKTEESPVDPQTAYAECKVKVETDVSGFADDAFSPTFMRNATAYGPSPRMRFDIVLNNLAGWAHTTGQIKMTSDGTPWRPLVHVMDICRAFACMLEADRGAIHNQVFNIGDTKENYRVREIAGIVAGAFPGCELTFGQPDKDNRSYRVSFDKVAEHVPAFTCVHNVVDGARELHDLFERVKLTVEMFESRDYTRLKQLKHLLETKAIDSDLFWVSSGS